MHDTAAATPRSVASTNHQEMKTERTETIFIVFLMTMVCLASAHPARRPNILWITSKDHGPQMGCHGDSRR
jgi:hypothetical protein